MSPAARPIRLTAPRSGTNGSTDDQQPAAGGDPCAGEDSDDCLFDTTPAESGWRSIQKFGGAVDPVGTQLKTDFDGDGIANEEETSSNIWVADYPEMSTDIAPPITMEIEVLTTTGEYKKTISSDITSDDVESRKSEGSEKFHQNEIAFRTVQYETEVSQASSSSSSNSNSSSNSSSNSNASASSSSTTSGSGGSFGFKKLFSIKASGKRTKTKDFQISVTANKESTHNETDNRTSNQSSSERKTVYEDQPFVNNIDRGATTVKSDSAAKKARKYRSEARKEKDEKSVIKPDAGFVRASLFIRNHSINMPVRMSNILCSLLFETPQGELRPVQKFRLRNDDYSIFSVEVYGGSEFGPYVVELDKLNTAEIRAAIQKGYTPKIFLIDYQMSHVRDSEYKRALAGSFTGDNLRIIEENAKGRTALLKLIGPNMRQMHRVAAFSTRLKQNKTDICKPENIDTASDAGIRAGVSMRVALERLKCSGIHVEFDHYVYDFSGTVDELIQEKVPDDQKKFYIYSYGIKSINGIENNIPCKKKKDDAGKETEEEDRLSVWGIDPTSQERVKYKEGVQACHVRLAELTEEQRFRLSAWTIFANGKYHDDKKILVTKEFTSEHCSKHCRVSVTKGLEAPVWVGDNYDIVYMSMFDINREQQDFGTHPFETGAVLSYNTSWNLREVGYRNMADYQANKAQGYHNYSDIKSVHLGSAALEEQIEMVFKLDRTRYLNPDFGAGEGNLYGNFSYSPFVEERKRFTIEEALDFELNLGVDTKWHHVLRDVGEGENVLKKCEDGHTSWNLREQIFTVCVALPAAHKGVASEEGTDIYLRPVLNNAYRNSIWPEQASKINKFLGRLEEIVDKGGKTLKVIPIAGTPAAGNRLQFGEKKENTHTIQGAPVLGTEGADKGIYTINLSSGVKEAHTAGIRVFVNAGITRAPYVLGVDSRYETTWNNARSDVEKQLMVSSYNSDHCAATGMGINDYFASTKCLGYAPQTIITNWLGNRGFDNNWTDSSLYDSLGATEGRELFLGDGDGLHVGVFNPVAKIEVRSSYTCALLENGGVKCWGRNSNGRLGNGTNTDRDAPVDVSGLTSGVRDIVIGDDHTCALLENGGVKCWGRNSYGQLGDGTTTNRNAPVQVVGLTSGVRDIVVGDDHTCALFENWGVKCWGRNNVGQLGEGTSTNRNAPVNASGLTSGVRDIVVGDDHTCALFENGGVKCWGQNNRGQLGDGTNTNGSAPVQVIDLTSGVRDIALGEDHTCALLKSGGVKCWGRNSGNQLGDGTRTDRNAPVQVTGLTSGVRDIELGVWHTCALLENGGVECWGSNDSFGRLGDGTTTYRRTPVQVIGLTSGVHNIVTEKTHTCVLLESGGVKCWGRNNLGQLGDGTTTYRRTPVQVIGLTSGVRDIELGVWHTCALLENGGVKCWGWNSDGQLGDGTTITHRDIPVTVKLPPTIIPKTHLFTSPLIERDYSVRARIKF